MRSILSYALALAQTLYSPGLSGDGAVGHGEYHGPYADGGTWANAYEHAADLVSQMTVEEKVSWASSTHR